MGHVHNEEFWDHNKSYARGAGVDEQEGNRHDGGDEELVPPSQIKHVIDNPENRYDCESSKRIVIW
jgi:hypothetical protein